MVEKSKIQEEVSLGKTLYRSFGNMNWVKKVNRCDGKNVVSWLGTYSIVLVILVLCSSCSGKGKTAKEVVCQTANAVTYEKCKSYTGVVDSITENIITTKNGNIIEKIYVEEGEMVTKGDKLFCVDTSLLKKKVKKEESGLEKKKKEYQSTLKKNENKLSKLQKKNETQMSNLKKSIRSLKKQYKNQKRKYEEAISENRYNEYVVMNDIYTQILATEEELEQLKLENDSSLEEIRDEIESYKKKNPYSLSKKKISQYKKTIKNSIVKAEVDGVVTEIFAAEYERATDGKVLKLGNNEEKCAKFEVSETDAEMMQKGLEVKVYSEYNNEQKYGGKIIKVSSVIKDGTITVISSILDKNKLLLGGTVMVDVVVKREKNMIEIEKSIAEEEDDGKITVMIARKEKNDYVIEKKKIEFLYEDEEKYYVTKENIDDKELLVIDSYDCEEGDRVMAIVE